MNKSMLASKNLPQPITKASEGSHWIRVLAAELALRLKDARELSPNLWPKTLILHARKGMEDVKLSPVLWIALVLIVCLGYDAGRSKQAPFPFTKELTVDTIATAGDKLWKELVGTNVTMNVTNVSLAFTGIDVAEAGQQSIADFLRRPTSASRKRSHDADNAIESHGHVADKAAAATTTTKTGVSRADTGSSSTDNDQHPDGLTSSYSCTKCGKSIKLRLTDRSGDHEELLMKAKLEHEDYHFAQDLARESGPARPAITADSKPSSSSSSNKSRAKSKPASAKANKKQKPAPPEPKGIEKFFRK